MTVSLNVYQRQEVLIWDIQSNLEKNTSQSKHSAILRKGGAAAQCRAYKKRHPQLPDQDLELLGLISCLKNTDMSIRQIRDFVNLSHQGPETLKESGVNC